MIQAYTTELTIEQYQMNTFMPDLNPPDLGG